MLEANRPSVFRGGGRGGKAYQVSRKRAPPTRTVGRARIARTRRAIGEKRIFEGQGRGLFATIMTRKECKEDDRQGVNGWGIVVNNSTTLAGWIQRSDQDESTNGARKGPRAGGSASEE